MNLCICIGILMLLLNIVFELLMSVIVVGLLYVSVYFVCFIVIEIVFSVVVFD